LLAVGEWVSDAPPALLERLGTVIDPLVPKRSWPAETTIRRLLARIDADALDRAVGAWLADRQTGNEGLRGLAVEGKSLRGAARAKVGRPPKHGPEFRFTKPEAWPEPAITTVTDTSNYGKAETQAWDRVHPRLTHRSSWLDHDGELPVVEGTLIRLTVEHLSKDRDAPPVRLWSSKTGAAPDDVDRFRQTFLRRLDLEHTFRFAKQTLGWTTPKLRTPEAADRWTWILIAAHTQLRLARPLAEDLRRPGRNPPHPTASPRPGSARGSGTPAHTCSAPPVFPNLVAPVPGPPEPRTNTGHPATTSAKPSAGRRPSSPCSGWREERKVSIALRCGWHTPQRVQSRSAMLSARSDVPKHWVCVTAPESYRRHRPS
jgi:hypothetical protein